MWLLTFSTIAIDELLSCTKRRIVSLVNRTDQLKFVTKLIVHRHRTISDNIETAAFKWAVGTKRRDNDVAAGLYRPIYKLDITTQIVRIGQKVKDSSIVPNVKMHGWQIDLSYVGNEPFDIAAASAQSLLTGCDRG